MSTRKKIIGLYLFATVFIIVPFSTAQLGDANNIEIAVEEYRNNSTSMVVQSNSTYAEILIESEQKPTVDVRQDNISISAENGRQLYLVTLKGYLFNYKSIETNDRTYRIKNITSPQYLNKTAT